MLNIESLNVTSFETTEATIAPTLENTKYPICIVYVSDCVSCPPGEDVVTY